MDYTAVVILGACGICLLVALVGVRKGRRQKKPEIEQTNELKIRTTGYEPAKNTMVSLSAAQEPLDFLYAKKNGYWICSRCETLNLLQFGKCSACGKTK